MTATNRPPDNEDRFALYHHAHADIWWAKTQEWNVSNWALLLMAGIVGAGRIIASDLSPSRTWIFAGLVLSVGLAAGWYLASLHSDIVDNRKVYRALESQTGIAQLRSHIPQRAGEASDRERGSVFLFVMSGGIGLAAGLAVLSLGLPAAVGIVEGFVVGVADMILVARAA